MRGGLLPYYGLLSAQNYRAELKEVKIGRCSGRIESIYRPYIDGIKEIREIKEEYRAPFVHG